MLGETISHYRVLEQIGEGGMGVVYVAEDTLLGRRVAIKTLTAARGSANQHFRMRFLREAQAVSKLSHPHIATLYDYGETADGRPYIVMELVDGKTLGQLMREESLTIARTIEIVRQVAEALSEAHRHGIVHRDIKPSNIAINERGVVKVLDFGLAKQVAPASTAADGTEPALAHTQTREGVIVGTPLYLSPEQALGVEIDQRSDVFSLGSVLYECISGRPAFAGKSDIEICANIIRDDPPPPSQFNASVPAELDRLTLKALAKKPEQRYQSADELIADFRTAEASIQISGSKGQSNASRNPSPSIDSVLHAPPTKGASSISSTLSGPQVPIGYVLLSLLLISVVAFVAWRLTRSTPYQPSPETKRWYDEGTRALQDGTYYKASKLLEEAVRQDNKFALAHARLAEAWAELGYFDKASAEISQANLLVSGSSFPKVDVLYLGAINANISHDFNRAVESYQQMVPLISYADKAHLYVDLGRAYEKNEDLPNAMANYKNAIKSDSQYAPAYLRMGILDGRFQDFTAGEEALDKALSLYRIQSNPEGMAEVLIQRGMLLKTKGETAKAREPLEEALQIVRTFSNPSQETKALLQLSSVSRLTGDTESAKRYSTEAMNLARNSGLSDLETQSLIELGNAYFFRSEIPDAEKYFKQALDRAQSDKIRVTEARAQFALGSMHIQQDEADEGIPFIRAALPFFEQNLYRNEIMQSQTLLGQAYALKGDQAEALKAFEAQLRFAQQLNNQLQIGLSQKSIGTVLGNQEKYPEALDYIERSYSVFNSLGNKLYVGYSLISRADMKWRLGNYDDATADLNLATSLAEQPDGKFKQLWGRLYAVKAPVALSQRDFGNAMRYAQQAIDADSSRTKHPAIEAQYTLGLAQFLSGRRGQGLRTCEQAVQLAVNSGDPRLLLGALLALAETMIESGDANGALANSSKAQELAARADQIESQWRALLIAGRASARLGDNKTARESLLKANNLLASLQQRWGNQPFESYLTRPDITRYREALSEASRAAG